MSVVTSVLLCTGINDYGIFDVNKWLVDSGNWVLEQINEYAGGRKSMQQDVYAGAYNYFDLDSFIAAVKTSRWEHPDDVQLLVNREEDDRFYLAYGKMEELANAPS